MTKPSNWINVLPLNEWTAFYDQNGNKEVTFKLESCEVLSEGPEYVMRATLPGNSEGFTPLKLFGGLDPLPISKNLSIRLHMPIEFHNVPGVGLSPKMVYIFPRGCRVQEYKPNGNQARRGG